MREQADFRCDNESVSPTPAQQARASAIAAEIAALAATGFALPGTLADRMTRCGGRTAAATPTRPACTGPTTSGPARKTARPPPAS